MLGISFQTSSYYTEVKKVLNWNAALKEIQDSLLDLEVESIIRAWHKRIDEIFKSMSNSEQ